MPVVLITVEELVGSNGPHCEILRKAGFEIAFPNNPKFARGLCTEQEGIEELRAADAVIAGSEYITAAMIAELPRLRVIARNGVGFDRVDIAAASAANIVVTITPTAVHEAAAEHTLALLFAVSKRIVVGDHATRGGGWPRDLALPIRGKTMGILGLGRIGRSTAVRCRALGMNVIAFDTIPQSEFAERSGIELVSFDKLVSECDVLSVHCPMNAETMGIINANIFEKMRPGAILINTARGPIVNEEHLIEALKNGKLAAAGLDVYEQEPPAAQNPLFELDNVVLTPHIGGCDTKSMQDMANESAKNIVELHQGRWPEPAIVNLDRKGHFLW